MPFGDKVNAQDTAYTEPKHFAKLDYAQVSDSHHATFRQYSFAQGRWMSPDPFQGSYDVGDPQSLNRYATSTILVLQTRCTGENRYFLS